jgi:2-polyprenyl-3-methyl-5-hydroxy-6-metoxy-1,4-benzoquinol methylase
LHYTLHSDRQSSHQQIAQLVRRIGRAPVLDVGAAQGFLGQLLQHDPLQIDAVEPHPRWAAHARDYYRTVYASTVEDAELPTGYYPVVVCADVLEHTVDPVSVLKQLRATATEDAMFIISLPNVAHIAARLLLLAGRFPQMERGIFDRTHLHFYTRATAAAMLRDAGLTVVQARPTPVPIEQIWPANGSPALLRALMGAQRAGLLLAPALFGFQWIFVARPALQSVGCTGTDNHTMADTAPQLNANASRTIVDVSEPR